MIGTKQIFIEIIHNIRPLLEYASPVWSPGTKGAVNNNFSNPSLVQISQQGEVMVIMMWNIYNVLLAQ